MQVSLALQLASGVDVLHQAGLSTHALVPLGVDTVALLPAPADAVVLNPFRFSACMSAAGICLHNHPLCRSADTCPAPEECPPSDTAACQRHVFSAQKADVWRIAAGYSPCSASVPCCCCVTMEQVTEFACFMVTQQQAH